MEKNSELISLHRSIYAHMKKKALSYESDSSPHLKQYRNNLKKSACRKFSISSIGELLLQLKRSRVIYLGDFHTFDQASKTFERLLKTLIKSPQKIILGIEFVYRKDQQYIDDFLSNRLSETEFLQKINYSQSWRFPWHHYRHFFQLAREHNIQIIALNSRGTLPQRDKNAANLICNILNSNANSTMLILFGEYHIVANKLPLLVANKCQSKPIQTILHQNLDEVYWRLVAKRLDHKQVIRFAQDEFSLQSSPPWIKYESMIYWYENLLDDPEFDIHETTIQKNENILSSSADETFLFLSQQIKLALELNLEDPYLENFNLYDHSQLIPVLKKIAKLKPKTVSHFYTKLVHRNKNFKIPLTNTYYCPNYSINRLAYLAGIHLQHCYLERSNPDYEQIICQKNQVNKLIFFLYRHLIAYFASKIINPYRKCDLYQDILKKYRSSAIESRKKTYLKLALDILDLKAPLSTLCKGKSLKDLSSAGKLVGYLMGELFYNNHYLSETRDLVWLRNTILDSDLNINSFHRLHQIIMPDNSYRQLKKRIF